MSGVFALDKPQGFTSFDAVAKLRGLVGEKKIGHSGTLDPMATGVLPIFVGGATKAIPLLEDTSKRYTATVKSGLETDTADITGRELSRREPISDIAQINAVLPRFTGRISQIPPMYSAVSVGGRRLYDIAREGKTVERAAREITVYSVSADMLENGEISLEVECSSGTYIRTLAQDICEAAGSTGCLSSLRRTKSGVFTIDGCVGFDEVRQKGAGVLAPVDTLFRSLRRLYPSSAEQRLFINGVRLKLSRFTDENGVEGERFAVYGDGFFAVARLTDGEVEKLAAFER